MSAVILVIEDESAIQELISVTLTMSGYGVLRADTAEAARQILKDLRPDLILSDWTLPGQSGL